MPSADQPPSVVFQLRQIIVDPEANLAKRFRALFSLKHLGAQGDDAAVEAIAAGFGSDSGTDSFPVALLTGLNGS